MELNQVQLGSPPFELPLEVGIYHEGGARPSQIVTVTLADGSQRFVITVNREPTDVRLDPGTWALFEADFGRRERWRPSTTPFRSLLASI